MSVCLLPACRQRPVGNGPTGSNSLDGNPGTVITVYWAGAERFWSASTNGRVQRIAALAESRAFLDRVIDRLALGHTPLEGHTNAPTLAPALIKSLVWALLQHRLCVEMVADTNGLAGITVWIDPAGADAKSLITNLACVIARNPQVTIEWGVTGALAGWICRTTEGRETARLYHADGRVVLVFAGFGRSLRSWPKAAKPADAAAPDWLSGTNLWLHVQGRGPHLDMVVSELLGCRCATGATNVSLNVHGMPDELRVECKIAFKRRLKTAPDQWRVPTRLVPESIVAFAAARDPVAALLTSRLAHLLGTNHIPHQIYYWSAEGIPFQGFVAWPCDDPGALIDHVRTDTVPRLQVLAGHNWVGEVRAITNDFLIWEGLPFIHPFIRAAGEAGNRFVLAGLAPIVISNNYAPAELFAQFAGQPEVVFYEWEYTPELLFQLRNLVQLFRLLSERPQIPPESPSWRWFDAITPLMGECVTSARLTGPHSVSVVRRATVGLSAGELVALASWVETPFIPPADYLLPGRASDVTNTGGQR